MPDYCLPALSLLPGHNPAQLARWPASANWSICPPTSATTAAALTSLKPGIGFSSFAGAQVSADHSAVSNRIYKLLEGANIKLGSVASEVMGASGRKMLEAIVQGEDDPYKLTDLALGR